MLGTDYTVDGPPGEADIPTGASSSSVTLHAIAGVPTRKGEKVTFSLTAEMGYKLGKPNKATVTIH
jgi:hypothetical protein